MFYAAYPTVGGIILSGIALAVVGGVLFFTWAFGYGLYLVLGRVGIVFAGIAVAAIAAWYLWDNSPSNVVARQQEQQKQERQRQQQELERQQQEHLRQERIRREAQERQRQEDINRRCVKQADGQLQCCPSGKRVDYRWDSSRGPINAPPQMRRVPFCA